jgi:hypothetical protein
VVFTPFLNLFQDIQRIQIRWAGGIHYSAPFCSSFSPDPCHHPFPPQIFVDPSFVVSGLFLPSLINPGVLVHGNDSENCDPQTPHTNCNPGLPQTLIRQGRHWYFMRFDRFIFAGVSGLISRPGGKAIGPVGHGATLGSVVPVDELAPARSVS